MSISLLRITLRTVTLARQVTSSDNAAQPVFAAAVLVGRAGVYGGVVLVESALSS